MEIEQAVAKAVRAAIVAAVPCTVYDHPPQNATMPFVAFERHTLESDDGLDHRLTMHEVTVSVWSNERGRKEISDLVGRIRRAVHEVDMTLDAGVAVHVELRRAEINREPDGVTYSAFPIVRVLTQDD